jgi:hypothetical protein
LRDGNYVIKRTTEQRDGLEVEYIEEIKIRDGELVATIET